MWSAAALLPLSFVLRIASRRSDALQGVTSRLKS